MFSFFRKILPDTHPFRLFYHKLIAMAAALFYGFPSRKMTVIGVTGTNGKTSTVNLIAHILTDAGKTVGMTSTINFQVGNKKWSNLNKQTTLGRFALQKMLKDMVKAGCSHAVLEVSSHAVTQSRIWGINFDIGVFMNITREHIDYHGSFEAYMRAKGMFFKKISRARKKPHIPKVAILNQEDPHFDYFDQFYVDRKMTFGITKGTLHVSDLTLSPSGSVFTLHMPNQILQVDLKLPGEANVYNILAASGVAIACGVSIDKLKHALKTVVPVPGRFEALKAGQPYTVVVDYAHDENSLKNLLKMYREVTKNRLIVVFGATGGGRDKGKRPIMGEIADKYADEIILTDDDPYSEDEWQIIEMISKGIKREEGDHLWKIPDRKQAIRLALTIAKEGDAVLLSGKGGEEIQVIRGRKIEWDDRKVVKDFLEREIRVEIEPGRTEKRENIYIKG